MNLKQLGTIWNVLQDIPSAELNQFSWLFRLRYRNKHTDIAQLSNVTIGTILKCTHLETPLEIYNAVNEELKLKFITQNDKCLVFILINKQIEIISKLLAQIDDIHPIRSEYSSLWGKISSEYNISPDIMLIDSISKRNSLSWDEASNLKWSQVYLMMKIDAQTAAFENEVNKKIMKKTK